MKKSLLLLLGLPFLLCGCLSQNSGSTPNQDGGTDSHSSTGDPDTPPSGDFLDEDVYYVDGYDPVKFSTLLGWYAYKVEGYNHYGGTFNNRLPTPSTTVRSIQDISAILDYCGFYKIPSMSFTFGYETNDKKGDINMAFWNSIMLPGVAGMKSFENEDGSYSLSIRFNDNANSYRTSYPGRDYIDTTSHMIYVHNYDSTFEHIDEVPYVGGQSIDVWNSDQLLYALVKGYTPVMTANSPAKQVYDIACGALLEYIYKDMNDYQKLNAIEEWLQSHSIYDFSSDNVACYVSNHHSYNPEEIASYMSGFFADGVFLNGAGVCYGYEKAQAILAALCGFDVIPSHGLIGGNSRSTTDPVMKMHNEYYSWNYYNSHGINLVNVDGRYGICDPTFRAMGGAIYNQEYSRGVTMRRDAAVMLTKYDWELLYTDTDQSAFELYGDLMVDESYDVCGQTKLQNGMSIRSAGESIENFMSAISNVAASANFYASLHNINTNNYLFAFQFNVREEIIGEVENFLYETGDIWLGINMGYVRNHPGNYQIIVYAYIGN